MCITAHYYTYSEQHLRKTPFPQGGNILELIPKPRCRKIKDNFHVHFYFFYPFMNPRSGYGQKIE